MSEIKDLNKIAIEGVFRSFNEILIGDFYFSILTCIIAAYLFPFDIKNKIILCFATFFVTFFSLTIYDIKQLKTMFNIKGTKNVQESIKH